MYKPALEVGLEDCTLPKEFHQLLEFYDMVGCHMH